MVTAARRLESDIAYLIVALAIGFQTNARYRTIPQRPDQVSRLVVRERRRRHRGRIRRVLGPQRRARR